MTSVVNLSSGSNYVNVSSSNQISLTSAQVYLNGVSTLSGDTYVNTTGSGNTTIGNASSTTGIVGPTNVNTSGPGTTSIGNWASTTNVVGSTNVNTSGSGTTSIGNTSSTTGIIGPTNINITGSSTTTLGNASATVEIDGTVNVNTSGSTNTNIGNISSNTNVAGTLTANNLLVNGNLTVNGTTTSINSVATNIEDNLFIVNSGPSGVKDGGCLVQRYQVDNDSGLGDVITDTPSLSLTVLLIQTGRLSVSLDITSSSVSNTYNGYWMLFTSGITGQVRQIVSYDGSTKTATLSSALSGTANITDAAFNINLYNGNFAGNYFESSSKTWRFALAPSDSTTVLTQTSLIGIQTTGIQSNSSDFNINTTSTGNINVGQSSMGEGVNDMIINSNVVLPIITASNILATDAGQNLTSLPYSTANTTSTLVQRDTSGNINASSVATNSILPITGLTVGINTTGTHTTSIGTSTATTNISGTINLTGATNINFNTAYDTNIGGSSSTTNIQNAQMTGSSIVTGNTTVNTSGTATTSVGNTSSTTSVIGAVNINNTLSGTTNLGNTSSTTNISGPTNINTSGAITTTVGNTSATNNIIGITNINTSGSATTTVGNTSATNNIVGVTNINTSGTSTTTVGNASATNNFTGTNNITGSTNINTSGAITTTVGNASAINNILGATNINTSGAITTTVGNASATNNILGATNINTSGATTTTLGNASATNNITGATNINTTGVTSTFIGNSNSGTVLNGVVSVNTTGTSTTSIGSVTSTTSVTGPANVNTTGSSKTTIGGSTTTTEIVGATNINVRSSTTNTTIGNSGGAVTIYGNSFIGDSYPSPTVAATYITQGSNGTSVIGVGTFYYSYSWVVGTSLSGGTGNTATAPLLSVATSSTNTTVTIQLPLAPFGVTQANIFRSTASGNTVVNYVSTTAVSNTAITNYTDTGSAVTGAISTVANAYGLTRIGRLYVDADSNIGSLSTFGTISINPSGSFPIGIGNSASTTTITGACTAINGISFGSGNPSLTTYDLGTWTVTISDGTSNFTLSTNVGRFYQIGNLIFFTIEAIWSTKGSATGFVRVSLPFAINNNWRRLIASLGFCNGIPYTGMLVISGTNLQNYITLNSFTEAGGSSQISCSAMATNGELQISGFYEV